jgi:hypothetical protein
MYRLNISQAPSPRALLDFSFRGTNDSRDVNCGNLINHGFRFAVSYLGKKLGPGKKLGNFSIALGVSPWAIVQ